jgi:hypothetical protein
VPTVPERYRCNICHAHIDLEHGSLPQCHSCHAVFCPNCLRTVGSCPSCHVRLVLRSAQKTTIDISGTAESVERVAGTLLKKTQATFKTLFKGRASGADGGGGPAQSDKRITKGTNAEQNSNMQDDDSFPRVPVRPDVESALASAQSEHDIHRFLASNRGLLAEALGYPRRKPLALVLSKFPLGSSYIPDFVVFFWDSNIFRVALIELEPVNDPVVTRAGVGSARLSSAVKQVADWKRWLEHGGSDLVLSLRRTVWEFAPDHLAEFFASHWVFSDTRYEFFIFIGRSSVWTPITTDHVNAIRGLYDPAVKVYSYDRLLRYSNDADR